MDGWAEVGCRAVGRDARGGCDSCWVVDGDEGVERLRSPVPARQDLEHWASSADGAVDSVYKIIFDSLDSLPHLTGTEPQSWKN
jgi:hypothetical protein